jgi:RNA polymerase sigma-54 factor
MKPLILRTIADELELHESTVSRITTQKYIYTAQGVFELKYFFSNHLDNDTGEQHSSVAIRAIIKRMVHEENPQKPLSDTQLSELLEKQGIKVARRTIAKYREEMTIPPSYERKQLS